MVYQEEENNYPKAFLATGIILAAIMALCYFIVFTAPPKVEDGTGGILVNYGTTDEGMGKDILSTDQPSVAPKANHTQPQKVTNAAPTEEKTKTESSDKKIVTQNTEDAAEVASKSTKTNTPVAAPVNKPAVKQVVNQNALYKGASNKGAGAGDGTTNTPGNQGSTNGSILSDNYGHGGSGNGLSLQNWRFVNPPDVKNEDRVPGTVAVDFTIDQNGNVIQASENRQRTRASLSLIQACVDAIKKSKFTSTGPAASGTQKGQMVFIFKVD